MRGARVWMEEKVTLEVQETLVPWYDRGDQLRVQVGRWIVSLFFCYVRVPLGRCCTARTQVQGSPAFLSTTGTVKSETQTVKLTAK